MNDEFNHGKTEQHLRNIDENIDDIKRGMREHNESDLRSFSAIHESLSEVKQSTKDASSSAYQMSRMMGKREEDFSKFVERIEAKLDDYFEKNDERHSSLDKRILVIETNASNKKIQDMQRNGLVALLVSSLISLLGIFLKR
jgi:predicted AAA+ superfamily ATPase